MSFLLTSAVLGTWVSVALGLCAIGALFLNRLGGIEPSWRHAYCAIWTGFALLIAGLMVWNFFLPVDLRALLTFTVVAALALVVERRWFLSLIRQPLRWRFAAACGVFAIWTANQSLAGGFGYDDYLYEFQAIRWFHDYPVVPGLANLHGRMGFNNSHHLFAAMLSVGLWSGAVNHIFNGLFIVLACVLLFSGLRDLAGGDKGCLYRSFLPALLLCPCVGLVSFGFAGSMLATLKADAFVAAATAVLACLFLMWATASSGSGESAVLTATIVSLGAVLSTVKISAIVFSAFVVVVVVVRELRHRTEKGRRRRMVYGALAVAGVLAVCFPIRGIILSGYPLYPTTAFGVNVDWKVPAAQADAERAYIKSCTYFRATYDPKEVSGWKWLPDWAETIARYDRINLLLPLFLTLISLPMMIARPRGEIRAKVDGTPPGWAYATLACASIGSLIVWFLQAPAGRFVIVQVWILFAAVLISGLRRQRDRWHWKAVSIGFAITLALAVLILMYWLRIPGELRVHVFELLIFAALWMFLFGSLRSARPRLLALVCLLSVILQYGERWAEDIAGKRYRELGSMLWLNVSQLHRRPPPKAVLRRTYSGLEIYNAHHSIFETPLPNAGHFNPYLQLRTGNMKDGFRNSAPLNSPYAMENDSPLGDPLNVGGKAGDSHGLAMKDSSQE